MLPPRVHRKRCRCCCLVRSLPVEETADSPSLLCGRFLHALRNLFCLTASSVSIQFAATDPDACTNCRTSSVLLTVRGSCFANVRTDSANRNVRSSRSRRFAPSSILKLGIACLLRTWDLGFGICRRTCGACRFDRFLRRIREIVRRD